MKIKGIFLATFSLIGISGALAQDVEYDDMYFTSEDRAKLRAQRSLQVVQNTPKKSNQFDYYDETENINPTDSYSARNVNPEYTSRAQSQIATTEDEDYFVDNYQYNRNELNNWNNNFNNWYNNSWYRPNYYGPGINTWNTPYYGYNSWNSPWYDPFWSYNGWSSSFSFHYGRGWNYGWGGNYNYWNRPYYGWDPYGFAYGYGMGYGLGYGGGYWNNYRYPSTIVIVNNGEGNGRGVVYGKRPSRSTTLVNDQRNTRSRSNINNAVRGDNNSGRISSQSRKQAEYYNRTRTQRNTNASYGDRSNTQYNRSRSWDNTNNNSSWDYNRSTNRSSTPSYSPSRSSSSSGTRVNTGSSSGGRRGRD